jgi:hypothetical protein
LEEGSEQLDIRGTGTKPGPVQKELHTVWTFASIGSGETGGDRIASAASQSHLLFQRMGERDKDSKSGFDLSNGPFKALRKTRNFKAK